MAKKVLLVFHLNFLKRDMGCSNYIYLMARVLKQQGYHIDFFTADLVEDISKDFQKFNQKEGNLIDNLHFVKRSSPLLPNSYCNREICEAFNKLINTQHYDFINIHYIRWADLITYSNIPSGTELIYSLQDSHFVQCSYIGFNDDQISALFTKERRELCLFDKINCISHDEMLFWQHLLPQKTFYFLPYTQDQKPIITRSRKKYDILFLGAKNPFNIEGLKWFLDEVYPLLNKKLRIVIAGKVLDEFKKQHPKQYQLMQQNAFHLIDFCEDLETLYAQTKVVIVPMLRGTGMKIKTIEALAHNIPIVSTLLGVDGFPDKNLSGIMVTDKAHHFADNINTLLKNKTLYQAVQQKQSQYFSQIFGYKRFEERINEIFTPLGKHKARPATKSWNIVPKAPVKVVCTLTKTIKLFGCLSLYSKMSQGGLKQWSFLGLPIFKVQHMENQNTKKYYVCGLPILKINQTNT